MTTSTTQPTRFTLSASSLTGDPVVNAREESLGDIHELMIDTRSGKVAYAVISFGGFLGMGDKLFAVPYSALRVDQQNKRCILDVDKKTLENAPGFDKDNWPDMNNPQWGEQIHRHYGVSYVI